MLLVSAAPPTSSAMLSVTTVPIPGQPDDTLFVMSPVRSSRFILRSTTSMIWMTTCTARRADTNRGAGLRATWRGTGRTMATAKTSATMRRDARGKVLRVLSERRFPNRELVLLDTMGPSGRLSRPA